MKKLVGGGLWTDFVLLRFSKFNICDSAKRFIQKMFIKSTCYSIIQVLQRKHEFGLLIPLQLHVQSTTLALHVGQNLEQGEPNLLRQQDGSPIHPILGNFETKSLQYSNGEDGAGRVSLPSQKIKTVQHQSSAGLSVYSIFAENFVNIRQTFYCPKTCLNIYVDS